MPDVFSVQLNVWRTSLRIWQKGFSRAWRWAEPNVHQNVLVRLLCVCCAEQTVTLISAGVEQNVKSVFVFVCCCWIKLSICIPVIFSVTFCCLPKRGVLLCPGRWDHRVCSDQDYRQSLGGRSVGHQSWVQEAVWLHPVFTARSQ